MTDQQTFDKALANLIAQGLVKTYYDLETGEMVVDLTEEGKERYERTQT